MPEKLKIKFLTAIWGARYIEEFARVSLPSYMAAGNLPFVAANTDFEIVIMTSTDSRDKFDELPIFLKLKALCPVRFIFIDDLITTGNYGVTLTLAYARGILDSGAEQTNTNFVFMNSDFILADGSLKTLVGRLQAGERCIMAPSLRARSETAIPALTEAVDYTSHTLTIPPRRMVQLAFDNLHPTVVGKTVTQEFVTCANHNQIYWQVDATTLLARYHLIFMLAIKPEVPMGPVNSYCDYGFVPELVPSGQFSIIDDTDDFFMLELQPSVQERHFLRCGRSTQAEIATELSNWTTNEHRRFAGIDVVFRSSDLPAQLAEARIELSQFVAGVQARMSQAPKAHVNHFYWFSGLQAWGSLKFPGEIPVLPPEVDVAEPAWPAQPAAETSAVPAKRGFEIRALLGNHFSNFTRLVIRSYTELLGHIRRMTGGVPIVPIWHHLWLDSRLILRWIKSVKKRPSQRSLLICDETSPLPVTLPKLMAIEVRGSFNDLLADPAEQRQGSSPAPAQPSEAAPSERYDNVFVHVYRSDALKSRRLLESAEHLVKPDGTIAIYIEHRNAEMDESNFSFELAQYVDDVLPGNWIGYHVKSGFAGGRVKRRLRLIERYLFRYIWPSSVRRLPHLMATAGLWPLTAVLMALYNFSQRNASSICSDYCSSALLRLTKISASAPAAGTRQPAVPTPGLDRASADNQALPVVSSRPHQNIA